MTVATLNVIQTAGVKVFDLSLGALAADLPAGEYPLCLVDAANAAINDALAVPDSVREQLVAALKFYADPVRYDGSNQRIPKNGDAYTPSDHAYLRDVTRDGGQIAIAALAAAGAA
jgi:nucleosome binding factor SPN SPT16 subunit